MTSSKHDHENYDPFDPTLDMAHKAIQRVFVPILKLLGPRVIGQRSLRIFYYII